MENRCHRCNEEVAPGTPFCPHCNAPQIRVVTSSESQTIASDLRDESPPSRLTASLLKPDQSRASIHWPSALPKTAASGFATVAMLVLVVTVTQVPALSLLVLPLGGALSVFLYSRGDNRGRITAGHGARLGAVTGLFAFIVYGVIVTAEMSAKRGELLDMLRKTLQEAAARNPNPQAQEMVQQIMTPAGLATLMALTAVIFLFTFLVLSSLGGSVGAAIVNSTRQEDE